MAHRIFLTVCGVFGSKVWALLFWCTGFSLVVVQGLEHAGSVVVACGLSCLWSIWNLVPKQGSNSCPLLLMDSNLLDHCRDLYFQFYLLSKAISILFQPQILQLLHYVSIKQFPNLGFPWLLGVRWMVSVFCCIVHCRMLGSIPPVYPLDAGSELHPSSDKQRLETLPNILLGKKSSSLPTEHHFCWGRDFRKEKTQ